MYNYNISTSGGSLIEDNADFSSLTGFGAVWLIIACVLAIVGGILIHFLFVKDKNEPKGKFMKWLKDFLAFKTMWVETILKITYYIATLFFMIASFAFLPNIFAFITMLIIIPIFIRLAYELSIMFVMIWRNTKEISENTKK